MILRPRISFTLLVVRTEAMSLSFRSFLLVELLKSVVKLPTSTAEGGPPGSVCGRQGADENTNDNSSHPPGGMKKRRWTYRRSDRSRAPNSPLSIRPRVM